MMPNPSATTPTSQPRQVVRFSACQRWRRRIRRTASSAALALLVAYLIVWWVALRIVEHPSWPPPNDAVTADQAQEITEAFARRSNPKRDDVAIPYAPTTASDVQFFLDGPAYFPAMLQDIAHARHSVHMQMFGITQGDIARQFIDALVARAESGIEVRLIVDAYGAKVDGQSKSYFRELRDAGVEVVINNEFPVDRDGIIGKQAVDWRQDEIGQADHRKTMVIDGSIGWIGGAGLQDHFNGGHFRDVFTRVQGDIVRQMQAVFLTSFDAYGGSVSGEAGSLAAYFPEPANPGTIRTTLLQNIPGGFVPGTQASRAIIEAATDRIDILNPYLTDPGIIDRIVDAARRGVRVRVIVPATSNNEPADAALRHNYPRLLDAGVEILEYPVVMHAKVTVADGNLIVGTINYDAWALYRNLEIALLFEDQALANHAVAAYVEPNIELSVPGVESSGTTDRIRNWIWDKLVYFL